ncbi:G-protein coupled receptor GRL101 [Elysia marginata]|uniref:G-protein coupled receptor GRL101 n=1 Tax=Elysia marginata TaxID=1093978 RepID=A0AAV4E9T8_9GAST|nr:G-protein coupled receptor GRL101 [Elysia marginata]
MQKTTGIPDKESPAVDPSGTKKQRTAEGDLEKDAVDCNLPFERVSPKCVMVLDGVGEVIGCRDLSHLSDCEHFSCPEGYVKCPGSYCIPQAYMADGKDDCLRGEDEYNIERRRRPQQSLIKRALRWTPQGQRRRGRRPKETWRRTAETREGPERKRSLLRNVSSNCSQPTKIERYPASSSGRQFREE